ncbi:MAG: hypothetical protein CSA74_06955 [Rhodobacterales bacterium]|nr:MAG: hypothetical protein CSA74_06955 [Rhodobacterales bacterium]
MASCFGYFGRVAGELSPPDLLLFPPAGVDQDGNADRQLEDLKRQSVMRKTQITQALPEIKDFGRVK